MDARPRRRQRARRSSRRRSSARDARSQRYEGLLQVFDAKGKIADKRWTFERLGCARRQQVGAALHGARRGQRRGAARRQPSRPRLGSVDVDAGDRARPAHRAAGSVDAVLRHRLQLRGSRGARRQPVRLRRCAARRPSTAPPCWKIESTPKETKSSQYTRSLRLDPQGQLRVRPHRELHQGQRRPPAELHRHPERAGHLDRARSSR